jgi:hypothetical protein
MALANVAQFSKEGFGEAHSSIAEKLIRYNGDIGAARPFRGPDGKSYIEVFNNWTGQKEVLVTNSPSLLRKDEWERLDAAVIKAALPRMKLWKDLRANVTTDLPNAMAVTIIQHQTRSRSGEAIVSMDAIRESERARPLFDIVNTPVPIVHEDWSFTLRETLVSRNNGQGVDIAQGEESGRNIAETIEKLALGVLPGMTFGGATLYGITSFPGRITGSLTPPTGTNGATTVQDFANMVQAASLANMYGPFMVYVSRNWTPFLGLDYSTTTAKTDTLRQRLLQDPNITDIKPLDFFNPGTYQVVLVPMDKTQIEAMNGIEIKTIQYESHGGMQLNFKSMAIQFPRIRADYYGQSGIVHYTG